MLVDAGVPSGLDPITEAVMSLIRDMDEEDIRDILRKAIKIRNAR